MTDGQVDLTLTPCSACAQTSVTNEQMVGCDSCKGWFHCRCVEVTEAELAESKWFCSAEECQSRRKGSKKKTTGKSKKTSGNTSDSDRSNSKSDRPVGPNVSRIMQTLREEQKSKEEELQLERIMREKRIEMELVFKKKRLDMERQLREREMELEKELLEDSLAREKDHLDRLNQMRLAYQSQFDVVQPEIKHLKTAGDMLLDDYDSDEDGSDQSSGDETSEDESDEEETDSDGTEPARNEKARNGPSKTQLALRNGKTRKLPLFTDRPEEWPLFIEAFEASTEACGFSDVENLVRLQESLKGSALESVRCQLLLPKSVPRVIKKLRQMYGRPEQLLQCHLDRIRKLDAPKAEKLASYVPFGNAVEQLCEHLKMAGLKQHMMNPLLLQDLVDKLPASDKREWVRYKKKKKLVTLCTLSKFLSRIVAEACEANVSLDPKSDQKTVASTKCTRGASKGGVYNHSIAENSRRNEGAERRQKPCVVCHRMDHRLRYCEDFRKLSSSDRIKLVEQKRLCRVCLNDHGNAECKFKLRCSVGECQQRHNPLLHPTSTTVAMNTHVHSNNSILFRILPVVLHCGQKSVHTLAFLDEGASVTLIERHLADKIGAKGINLPLTINWTSDISRSENDSLCPNLWISPPGAGDKMLLKAVQTVKELLLPWQSLEATEVGKRYAFLRDVPFHSYAGDRPGLLIGLNNIHVIAPVETKLGSPGEPIAVKSRLGWTVYGPQSREVLRESFLYHHEAVSNQKIYDLIKDHYALEESVVATIQESKEEKRARDILEQTTKRKKTPDLYENVKQQVVEYLQKGYAHVATAEELAKMDRRKMWYLPLNLILNTKKPGKVRLVWDAAARVDGVSLNSQLLKGPDMLTSLTAVVCRFRERPIAFGADIREMYHQLKIRKEDKSAQLFVFRRNRTEKPDVYIMDVATFGASSSPCSAQFVKNLNAHEFMHEYPDAAKAIVESHYVDDYFDSVNSVEEAIQRAKDVTYVHARGGFQIRNWVSNAEEVLRSLGEQKSLTENQLKWKLYRRTIFYEVQYDPKIYLMWARWSKEYLPSINHRTKWFEVKNFIRVGDLVFVVDGRVRKKWTRGIVEQIFPGSDGRIRQVSIKTSGGVFKRATTNLAVLEIRDGKSGTVGGSAPELRPGECDGITEV
ncbi:uncharacterized protein LOC134206002 [Armigeres subalbatus]|uniref:uncharacterized protein LOC134206002 n=1 Tax=Armigeres subalbatus TaxID=124917 RepID=UPI002ECFD213